VKKYLCILGVILSVSTTTSFAQYGKPAVEAKGNIEGKYLPTDLEPGQAEFIGFRNPASDDLNWQPSLSKTSENESEDNELLEKIKAAKGRLRAQAQGLGEAAPSAKTTTVPPVVDTNFIGINNGGGSTPLDNTIAISNGGKIVAFVNSKVSYYTTAGTATYTKDLYTLIGDASLINNMCDPKVVYDNVSDRFIFYTQICDLVPNNSKVILGFSKTNDPAAGWYFYKLSGNPLNDASIFDYPKMGMSNDEIFVTGNLFHVSGTTSTFNQAIIYQVAKAPCYAGGTISVKKYTGITGAFTIVPASYGLSGSYGPGIFLVSSDGATAGSSSYKLYDITGNIASGTSSCVVYGIPATTSYSTPGDADQMGTGHKLNTGDCRAMDGFYLHGYVHFVHNTDAGSSYSGISYVRVKVSNFTATQSLFSAVGTADRAYPAISTMTNDSLDKSVLIAFNETSTTAYPCAKVVSCGNNFAWSTPVLVKAGVSYVNYGYGGATDRWGDYTGMCRRYNSNPAVSWMAGMYGNSSKQWSQWIAKIKGTTNIGVPEIATDDVDMKVYPNPVYSDCSIKFSIKERMNLSVNIIDMQGKVVKDLYSGIADAGESVFSFNKANLSAGTYFVRIMGGTTLIKSQKIVIGE
jgi:hypothetical protein